MNFNPFPDLLLLITVVLGFGFTIFSFIRATKLTKNKSYLYLTIGFVIGLVGYLITVLTTFFSDTDNKETLVLTLIILVNIFMVSAFIVIVNSLILIREDRLPVFSHIAGFLGGACLFILVTIKPSDISYNAAIKFWEVDYNMNLLLPIGIPVAIFFTIYFALYLTRKFQKWVNYKRFDHIFIGFLLLAFWMIGAFIEQLRVARHFVFPIAILFFGIAVFFDPLNMLASNKLPEEIILVSQNNHPIARYLVKEKNIQKNLDEIKLLIAGKKIINDSLNSSKKSKEFILEGKQVKIINFKHFHIIAIGNKIDRNSTAAIHFSFCKFKKITNIEYLHTSVVMNEPDEKLFKDIFSENFKRIDAVKIKKKKKKEIVR